MYYLIEYEYVGPNQDQHRGEHYLSIGASPGRMNLSGEECSDGWLGTTNDCSIYAHGEFASLVEAEAEAIKMGFVVEIDPPYGQDGAEFPCTFRTTIAHARAHVEAADWFDAVLGDMGITAATTDVELYDLANREEERERQNISADHPYGLEVHGLLRLFTDHRNQLRDVD